MCNADWLSPYKYADFPCGSPKSASKYFMNWISAVAFAIDLYSASAEDLDTTCCFLGFHDIKQVPNIMQNQLIDLLVTWHAAQSASQYTLICNLLCNLYNKPLPGVFYLNGKLEKKLQIQSWIHGRN